MMDEFYLKDVCDIYPMLKSPVLFVLLGERGKEAFPFLKRTHGGMGDAIQMLQIAAPEYKVQDPSVEFVNIQNADWKDNIDKALENNIIPVLKTTSYTMKGMISVNVLIDLDDKDSYNLEEISEHIYSHLVPAFENGVDFYFYCFTAVKFTKERSPIIKSKVIEKIQKLHEPNDWVKLVYVVSDLNEDDVYSSNNIAKKYLALVLNTYLQAGYHVDPDASLFDSFVFADKDNPTRDFVFQAIGCAPLELNTDLMKTFFKMRITQYMMEHSMDDQGTLKNIFSSLGAERHIVSETFENAFPRYYDSAEYIAYNQKAMGNISKTFSNRTWLRRIFNNNHQEYFENNISVVFLEKLKVAIGDNSRNLEGQFRKAIEKGQMNPFHIANYEQLAQDLETTIHDLEAESAQLELELRDWEDKSSSLNKYLVFGDKMMNRFRRRKIKEWLELKRKIAIQEGVVRYTHMERDCIIRMLELAKECQHVAENYVNGCKSSFSKLERAAFSYQTDHFDDYYTAKTSDAMEHHITEQEKQKLYTVFCKFMLDEKNGFSQFNAVLEEFIKGEFWRQAKVKNHLVEEILDRMRATRQKSTDDVLTQLYISTVEAKNVDLRVIGTHSGDNDICCFMGPSDNELISFLQRYKQKDSRVRVLVVEQLTTPVVLYFKFNISDNEIRI